METVISSIIKELKLDENQITNIYNYGSWVYGTNHEKSDRDFLIVMKNNNRRSRRRLIFWSDFDYFHSFDLRRTKNCDVTIHSCENFELLLKKNYMLAVECVLYPDEFILKNEIDYRTIYLTKYYNPLRLKQVAFYENQHSFRYIIDHKEPNDTIDKVLCDAVRTTTINEDRLLKYLFHGVRYLDFGEQLMRTKSIYDFKRASYILFEMKRIFLNSEKDLDSLIDYIKMKGNEYKALIDQILPTNIIHDTFKVEITVDSHQMEEFIDICKLHNLKPTCIYLDNGNHRKQVMASFSQVGMYPDIIQIVKEFTHTQLSSIEILRIKIKSSALNENLPSNDIDKLLFWDSQANYFEFHYKILVKSPMDLDRLRQRCEAENLYLSQSTYNKSSLNNLEYICTMRLFEEGKINAISSDDKITKYLSKEGFVPLTVEQSFVVYDSNIDLDSGWNSSRSCPYFKRSYRTTQSIGSRYRIGCKNRKVFDRSSV